MENVIYNEMRMRGWLVDVGNIFNRVRNTEGQQQRITLEVDFVCNKGSNESTSNLHTRCRMQKRWSKKNVHSNWSMILSIN